MSGAERLRVDFAAERAALRLNIDAGCLNRVAVIAMREVQRATAGAGTTTEPAARSGGVLFVHRLGAALTRMCICTSAFWMG